MAAVEGIVDLQESAKEAAILERAAICSSAPGSPERVTELGPLTAARATASRWTASMAWASSDVRPAANMRPSEATRSIERPR